MISSIDLQIRDCRILTCKKLLSLQSAQLSRLYLLTVSSLILVG